MPISPVLMGLLPSIISAGGSLVGSIANHVSARNLSNNAFRQNVRMWNMQNMYNSPVAQVGRLRAAGLNPALAYGGSSSVVGNSNDVPQLDYQGVFQNPLINPDFMFQAQQAMNLASQRQLQKEQGDLAAAQTIESLNRGELSGAEKQYAEQYAYEKLRSMRLSNDKVVKECEQIDKNIDLVIATKNLTAEQINSLMFANEFADRTMEYRVAAASFLPAKELAEIRELNGRLSKYAAEVNVLRETGKKLMTENSFLPALLTSDLGKALTSIGSMKKQQEYFDSVIGKLSVETGIEEKRLKTFFWREIVMPDVQSSARLIGGLGSAALIGAL